MVSVRTRIRRASQRGRQSRGGRGSARLSALRKSQAAKARTRTIATSRRRITRTPTPTPPKRITTRRAPTATVRRRTLTRATRKGASRVKGLTVVRQPTTPVRTRTGGGRGTRTIPIRTVPPKRTGTTFPVSRPRGGQGAARSQPRINQTFVPRQGALPTVQRPEIEQVGGTAQDQAFGFAKDNPIILIGGALALLLLLKR